MKQPKITSDLRGWKNYTRKASLKEKNPLQTCKTRLQKTQGNKPLKSSSFGHHKNTAQPCSTRYISPHKSRSIKITRLKVPPTLAFTRSGPTDGNYGFRKAAYGTGLFVVSELPLCKDFHRQLLCDKGNRTFK